MKKATEDTRSWVSLLFVGLILIVVVVSGGAAYAIFKKPEPTPKRTASAEQVNRVDDEGRTNDATQSDKDEARTGNADREARAMARNVGGIDDGAEPGAEPADELDEDVTWKRAPWDNAAEQPDEGASNDWTPTGIAALEPKALVESIRAEGNPAARRKLVLELLSRGLNSPQMAQVAQESPESIVDVIRTEPNQVSRAKLAEQMSEVELPPAAKEDAAVELLLLPDGSLKVTAMEMLLGEPESALSRLQERQVREEDPEKLEVIESAIAYLQKREQQQ